MKTSRAVLIAIAIACLTVPLSKARITPYISYQDLLYRSDLVVIAAPTSKTADTEEKSFLPNIFRYGPGGPQSKIESIGVETPFKVSAILKGDKSIRAFVLHHYREAFPPAAEADGPFLVFFDPADMSRRSSYLLFLVREPDGRYAPTADQTDPGYKAISNLPMELN
jgi:hypothetical protein